MPGTTWLLIEDPGAVQSLIAAHGTVLITRKRRQLVEDGAGRLDGTIERDVPGALLDHEGAITHARTIAWRNTGGPSTRVQ